jgi:hypothetical protein
MEITYTAVDELKAGCCAIVNMVFKQARCYHGNDRNKNIVFVNEDIAQGEKCVISKHDNKLYLLDSLFLDFCTATKKELERTLFDVQIEKRVLLHDQFEITVTGFIYRQKTSIMKKYPANLTEAIKDVLFSNSLLKIWPTTKHIVHTIDITALFPGYKTSDNRLVVRTYQTRQIELSIISKPFVDLELSRFDTICLDVEEVKFCVHVKNNMAPDIYKYLYIDIINLLREDYFANPLPAKIEYPSSLWQYFKRRWFNDKMKERWPVKYETYIISKDDYKKPDFTDKIYLKIKEEKHEQTF